MTPATTAATRAIIESSSEPALLVPELIARILAQPQCRAGRREGVMGAADDEQAARFDRELATAPHGRREIRLLLGADAYPGTSPGEFGGTVGGDPGQAARSQHSGVELGANGPCERRPQSPHQ